MGIFEIWLLALSLALDCFSMSMASGIILKRTHHSVFFRMAFFFGLFQALMPVIGWLAASTFSDMIQTCDHWIAFGLLVFLGIRMILASFKSEEDEHFDPTKLPVILTLSVATSIDALAIGITFAFTGYKSLWQLTAPTAIIGFVSFALSLAGSYTGALVGKRIPFRMELAGGVVLIGLGTKILLEHIGIL